MGILDSFLPQGGLLGLGGMSGNAQPQQALLGGLYDPQELQKIKIKNALLGAGIGLLTQGPSATPISFASTLGRGLAGGLTQAQQAGQDYMSNAKDAYQMKRMQTQDDYINQQHARDLANQQAYDKFVSTLPPDEQTIAKMDPAGFASNYFARKNMQLNSSMVDGFAAPQPPAAQPPQAQTGIPGGLGIQPFNSAPQPQQQAPQQMGLGGGPQIDLNSIPLPQSILSEAKLAAMGKDGMAGAAKIISDYRQHQADQMRDDYYKGPGYQAQNELSKGIAGQSVKDATDMHDKAQAAVSDIGIINQGRDLLNSGMYTGKWADAQVAFNAALEKAGITSENPKVSNTQAYAGLMGNRVGNIIKQFGSGTGLSDADRQYAQAIAGGNIAVDETAIRKLLDIGEKIDRITVQRYNKQYYPMFKNNGAGDMYQVDEPAQYTPPVTKGPLQGKTSTGVGWSFQ